MSPALVAEAKGFLGRRYDVTIEGREPLTVTVGGFSRQVAFEADGEGWILRTGSWRGRLTLERQRDGYALARAHPRSWFSFSYEVELADRRLALVSRGFWGRRLELIHGDRVIGRVRIAGFAGRRIEAVLPRDLPLSVQMFIVLAVILIQRRRAASAAAAG